MTLLAIAIALAKPRICQHLPVIFFPSLLCRAPRASFKARSIRRDRSVFFTAEDILKEPKPKSQTMEDKFLIGGLARATLAVILVLILPGPASPAPLALRVHVPVDRWRPVAVQPRPTFPAKPREQVNLSVPKPLEGDSGEIGGDDGDDDGDEPAWRLKFRGMDLPRQFGAYDLDHNRGVSLVELAAVTDTELRDAKEPFDAADLDGNKVLSQEEFTQAPWLFDAGGITLLDSAMDHGTEIEANDGGVETRQP